MSTPDPRTGATSAPPLVSVVLPVHDGAAFVRESIASVLAQSYRPFELIVVDDGSTDATPVVLARILDPRLRVIRNANGGVAHARNAGVRAARGPVVAFLDHDDLWLPGHLTHAVPILLEAPDRFAYADLAYFGEPAREGEGFPPEGHAPARTYAEAWRRLYIVTPGQVVARRADVLAAGGFPEDRALSGTDDRALWLALVARGVLPHPTRALGLRYRLHPGQASRRKTAQKRARLLLQERTAFGPGDDTSHAPLVPPEVAGPYLAELGLDLAHDLLDEDPKEALLVARAALLRDPRLAAGDRWASFQRKRRRRAIGRLPIVGPLLRRLGGSPRQG